MKAVLLRHRYSLLGAAIGAVTGFLYWKFYGCTNGCTITGSPLNSTLYMAFMGALVPGMFKKDA